MEPCCQNKYHVRMEQVEDEMEEVVGENLHDTVLEGRTGWRFYQAKLWNTLEDHESSQVAKVGSGRCWLKMFLVFRCEGTL